MKTIFEWFKQLPEPEQSHAISNTGIKERFVEVPSLLEALNKGFTWHTSPQGHDYWEKLHERYANNS